MAATPRILFVDDEPSVVKNLSLLLRNEPWEVLTATSGAEALSLLREKPCDVVVSDERMPEMSGAEFLSHVYRDFPDTTRIILSGQASLDATIRAINDAGIFRFLTKPCAKADLVQCLRSALEAREAARRAAMAMPSTSDAAIDALDEAIETLTLAFQPIAYGRGRRTFGHEVLARPLHPDLPDPKTLFDAAEATGRVLEVEAVIRERIGARLQDLAPDQTLFVNLHPRSLADPDFFAEDNPLFRAPERIVLEITERASLDSIADLTGRVGFLKERGFRIAVDDLGAGYAGLNTFARLSPEVVKLDIELIRDVDRSSTRRKVIDSMVRLSRDLDFLTVAEGVETLAELRTIVDLGCDLVQGYVLARPSKSFAEPAWPEDRLSAAPDADPTTER
ncbi:MAG: EAL domain-containing protein [Spirochaetaceae bacterium]|nr:EAL domain-containing protein [Spirochaetaceae bacterium]